MSQFRQLMQVVFLSGVLAGLALFIAQYFIVVPQIKIAETYEDAAEQTMPGMVHADEGWKPENGWQRVLLTALSTALSSIAFAAILVTAVSLRGKPINARIGLLWGLAGLACFVLAPSLGLPPQPPGVPVADLSARQLWWASTVAATAIGLFLIVARRNWLLRIVGVASLLIPHLIGAPIAAGSPIVPAQVVRRFMIASLATNGAFWLLLGVIVGFLYNRSETPGQMPADNRSNLPLAKGTPVS